MASGSSIIVPKIEGGFLQRLAREGQLSSMSVVPQYQPTPGSRPVVTAGAATQLVGSNTALGRLRFMLEANLGVDQAASVWFQGGQSSFSGAIAQTAQGEATFGANGGEKRWNFQGGLIIPEFSSFSLGYVNPTTSGAYASGGATWIDVTADLNFNAPFVIIFIGDSITYAQNSGSTDTANMNGNNGFPMIIRNHLLAKGINVRHINKGVSGMTGPQAQIRLNDNSFYHCVEETDRVCLIIEAMGMNDAASGITTQNQFTGYLDSVYALLSYYPNANLIAMSPTGTNDGGRIPFITSVRQWKQAWVAAKADARVTFADGTKAYGGSGGASSTPDGSIASPNLADGVIHPGITGNAAIVTNPLGPAIAASKWGQTQPAIRGGW